MLVGYGARSKGYKISGDIAIAGGLLGIPIVIFYDKIYLLIRKFLFNALSYSYVLAIIGFLGIAGVTLWLFWKKGLLAKKQNQPIISQLSSEIDECLWHLRRFWRDYQRAKDECFNRPKDFSEIARIELEQSQIMPREFRLSLPNWYDMAINQYSPSDILPRKRAKQIEQFYQNLSDLKKIKERVNENQLLDDAKQFEDLIEKALNHGNPLKT